MLPKEANNLLRPMESSRNILLWQQILLMLYLRQTLHYTNLYKIYLFFCSQTTVDITFNEPINSRVIFLVSKLYTLTEGNKVLFFEFETVWTTTPKQMVGGESQ